jgi:DNA-directed RNA polymerase subunit M/transcription elongation factor TFIIS
MAAKCPSCGGRLVRNSAASPAAAKCEGCGKSFRLKQPPVVRNESASAVPPQQPTQQPSYAPPSAAVDAAAPAQDAPSEFSSFVERLKAVRAKQAALEPRHTDPWAAIKKQPLLCCLVLVAALGVGYGMFTTATTTTTDSWKEQQKEVQQEAAKHQQAQARDKNDQRTKENVAAWVMTQSYVKAHLVSPGSADFGGVFGDYQDPNLCVAKLKDGSGRYLVKGWVDSQNKFGAKLRSTFLCLVRDRGNDKWECESLDIQER